MERDDSDHLPCSIVRPGRYRPNLVVPDAMRGYFKELFPDTNGCILGWPGLYDPPIALRPARYDWPSETVRATIPAGPIFETAIPGQTVDSWAPPITPAPIAPEASRRPRPGRTKGPHQDPPGIAPNPAPIKVVTGGGQPFQMDPTGGLIIAPGTTLTKGGPAAIVSGTAISVGLSAITLISPSSSTHIPFRKSPITFSAGSQTFVADGSGTLVIVSGTTLHSGDDPVTISDAIISIGVSGAVIIDPSSTRTVPLTDAPSLLALMIDSTGVVFGPGTTLHAGDPAITIAGTTFSVAPTAVVVVDPEGRTSLMKFTTSEAEVSATPGVFAKDPVKKAEGGRGRGKLGRHMVGVIVGISILWQFF
ncbi:hypothetical protein K469DRAFT_333871 [Zopfia rhizophila CBS 207.26]|uniref:Uncharacterized protein n=1 Tax=Zopfia rhizophila CBS 207.26 TaxID=1314779 RepID=A0A6A6DJW9_9PEZI|nr:hypothetical protein K469DRAFT_333871 [Zopfia rhizophila CBS 207.26]